MGDNPEEVTHPRPRDMVGPDTSMGHDKSQTQTKDLSSSAQAQALMTKLSPRRFRALHLQRKGVSLDSKVRWKRRACLTIAGQVLAEEGGPMKRPAKEGSGSKEETSFPSSKKARSKVAIS